MTIRTLAPVAALAFSLGLAGPAAVSAQDVPHAVGGTGVAPLFDDRGTYHWAVSTKVPEAQRYFDQGMRLMSGFNLEEAERSFEQAEQLDPTCAMCAWGTALSLGPHINLPALPDRTVKANAAAQRAQKLAASASPYEQALIAAIATRYSDPAPTAPDAQAKLDSTYAAAMHGVMQKFPDNVDAKVLWAEAEMDVHPWDYYTPDGEARPWTPEIVSTLESVLAKSPNHVQANHLYIHAVEASKHPERGLAAAQRLEGVAPGDGHLVHMPSHIYKRIGRYDTSAEDNRKAIKADDRYRAAVNPQGFYLMYVAHNHQFLMASCWMSGRFEEAIKEARAVTNVMPLDMLRQMPGFDLVVAYPVWTLVRFGRWQDVLQEPLPPSDFAYACAVTHAARAIAHASLGHMADAATERDSMAAIASHVPAEATEGLNSAKLLLSIASGLVDGVIAAKSGKTDQAIASLTAAVQAEDQLRYDEPSDWYFPARHALGDVLLNAGRAKEARAVYEADLARNPDNGWSLTGLAKSMRATKDKDAGATEARAEKAWKNADQKFAASWL